MSLIGSWKAHHMEGMDTFLRHLGIPENKMADYLEGLPFMRISKKWNGHHHCYHITDIFGAMVSTIEYNDKNEPMPATCITGKPVTATLLMDMHGHGSCVETHDADDYHVVLYRCVQGNDSKQLVWHMMKDGVVGKIYYFKT